MCTVSLKPNNIQKGYLGECLKLLRKKGKEAKKNNLIYEVIGVKCKTR